MESLRAAIKTRQNKVIADYDEQIKAAPRPTHEVQELTPEGMAKSIEAFYENSRFKD